MEFLRRQLDDTGARPCGICQNCRPHDEPKLRTTTEAGAFLRQDDVLIEPRNLWPAGVEGPRLAVYGISAGRALCRWSDLELSDLIRRGKYEDERFDDVLVEEVADLLARWNPAPFPEWVTAVPGRVGLVADFAARLAQRLGLEFVESLRKLDDRPPQKHMTNSIWQARNVLGALAVNEVRTSPVLLVDDMVDSRWTLTSAGSTLRLAGVPIVYPCALADTSGAEA